MSKISNVLTMINLLNSGKQYTINELANILEVTPRMVRIYKEELEKAGIYINTVRGKYGGYILDNSIKLPLKKITKEDIKTLRELNNPSLNIVDLRMECLKRLVEIEIKLPPENVNNSIGEIANLKEKILKK